MLTLSNSCASIVISSKRRATLAMHLPAALCYDTPASKHPTCPTKRTLFIAEAHA